jgi:hypothetical protein
LEQPAATLEEEDEDFEAEDEEEDSEMGLNREACVLIPQYGEAELQK